MEPMLLFHNTDDVCQPDILVQVEILEQWLDANPLSFSRCPSARAHYPGSCHVASHGYLLFLKQLAPNRRRVLAKDVDLDTTDGHGPHLEGNDLCTHLDLYSAWTLYASCASSEDIGKERKEAIHGLPSCITLVAPINQNRFGCLQL
jgi:hypothetical protein